ncbi:MAG: WYL domain-containing protein [Coriobacteriales bacterium]|nr:WYL domain-containing protein [Coriobacteriales bacterium]
MTNARSQRSGRKNNNERIRELVALIGSLSKTGDSISLDAISSRLGLSLEEAKTMMDIVCQASSEEWGGLLISSNDEGTEFTLQYPGVRGRPIRLTKAESIALIHALDLAGITEQDPLRQRLLCAFSSSEVDEEVVKKALGGSAVSPQSSLLLCAQSQVERRSLTFLYKGIKDSHPRKRRAAVRTLAMEDGRWYVAAHDLDLGEERTFRVDRMADATLGPAFDLPTNTGPTEQRMVGITFTDLTYYTMFDWPGLRVIRTTPTTLYAEIPYYGEGSTWLLRRICAGKGCIIVDDDCIMRNAQKYAARLLASG